MANYSLPGRPPGHCDWPGGLASVQLGAGGDLEQPGAGDAGRRYHAGMSFSFNAKGTRDQVLSSLGAVSTGPDGQVALDLLKKFMTDAPATDLVAYEVTAYGHSDPLGLSLPSMTISLTCKGMPHHPGAGVDPLPLQTPVPETPAPPIPLSQGIPDRPRPGCPSPAGDLFCPR